MSPERGILAYAVITPAQTDIAAEDLYNEPARNRLDTGLQWVRFFDQDSSYLKNLMALVNYSPTLRRIIHDKTSMTVGDGFIPVKGNPNVQLTTIKRKDTRIPETVTNDLEAFLSNVNLKGETLQDVLKNGSFEYDAFGNAVFEMVRGTVGREPFLYVYSVPMYMVGIRKAGPDRIVKSLGVYDLWEEVPLTSDGSAYYQYGFRELPLYPTWSEPDETGTQRTAIHIKNTAPGFDYFGLPEWISAIQWAEIEYRIPKFNISKFENGFMPSALVQFFGSMTQTEAETLINRFQAKMTGTGNNSKVFMQVVRDEKLKANVQQMGTNQEGEFIELQEMAANALVVANRWSKSLAGFTSAGQLGTNQQIRQELEYLQNTVVKPRQNMFLSRMINPFMREAAATINGAWRNISLTISNSLPVSFMGDINIDGALTQDEKREILGYGPIEIPSPESPPTDDPAENTV